jgi:hypothetical protein
LQKRKLSIFLTFWSEKVEIREIVIEFFIIIR